MSEQDLVKSCLQYLKMKNLFFWRNNTGAMSTEKNGKKYFMHFGAVGSPDIFVLYKGKLIGIECKYGNNKQSEAQKAWEGAMKQHGGEYWLIYDISELVLHLSD